MKTTLMLLLCAAAYSQPVTFDFQEARAAGLVVLGPSDGGFDAAFRQFQQNPNSKLDGFSTLRPYSFILINGTAKPISMVSVRWEDAGQLAAHYLYRTRSYLVVPSFKPGQSILLFPGFPASGSTSPDGAAAINPKWQPRRFQAATQLVGSIDAVIFGDGELVGPDKSGAAVKWEAERQALLDTAADLERETKEGRDGGEFLSGLSRVQPEHSVTIQDSARDVPYHYGNMRAAAANLILAGPKDGRTRAKIAAALKDHMPAIYRKGEQ